MIGCQIEMSNNSNTKKKAQKMQKQKFVSWDTWKLASPSAKFINLSIWFEWIRSTEPSAVLYGIMVDYRWEFLQGHISTTLGFLLDRGLLNYRIIYTPEFPYCSPLSPHNHSSINVAFLQKLLKRQGGCVCNGVCVHWHTIILFMPIKQVPHLSEVVLHF